MERSHGLLNSGEIVNPKNGNSDLRQRSKAQFYQFTFDTYKSLYTIESRLLTARSTISVLCRLDIGLMVVKGKVNYFINDVERSQNTSLWNNPPEGEKHPSHIGLIGVKFAKSLHMWISKMIK